MSYYKVLKDGKVIDVLDRVVYLNYQEKHRRMQFCNESKAQAILSSDSKTIWHEETLYNMPVSGYDTVRIEEIDKDEYEQEHRRLKIFNGRSIEEVTDAIILSLIEEGVI